MDQSNEHEAGPATPRPQHTPGPWFYDPGFGEVVTAERRTSVTGSLYVAAETVVAETVTKANGLLIAAAPDLLAACEAFLSPKGWEGSVLGAQMRAAVAKTKGQEQ